MNRLSLYYQIKTNKMKKVKAFIKSRSKAEQTAFACLVYYSIGLILTTI